MNVLRKTHAKRSGLCARPLRICIVALVVLMIWTPGVGRADVSAGAVLLHNLEQYPEAQPRDLQKLIHQAFLGPAHWPQGAAAQEYLWREIQALAIWPRLAPVPPLVEEATGPFIRVHLEPYLMAGGDPERLLAAFERSATMQPDSAGFFAAQRELLGWLRSEWEYHAIPRERRLEFADSLDALQAELAKRGWPAVRHSEKYRQAYRPHYRIVAATQRHQLLRGIRHPVRIEH